MDRICRGAGRTTACYTVPQNCRLFVFGWLLLHSILLQSCSAYEMTAVDVSNTTYYKELTQRNIIVVDELHVPITHTRRLEQRQNASNETMPSESAAPSLDTATGLPMPFDTSLGSNFSDPACPQYFAKFLADATFQSCLPMSVLLQNSMSFFQAARSTALLKKTLDASCSASLAVCSPLMSQISQDLISPTHCQQDYMQQNPLVMQAYAGLNAYEPLYRATCLKANSTGDYCFADAMESKSAADSYPYYTAVGLQLPNGSAPACSACLHDTMAIFAGYAVQKNQALSQTYLGCAIQVNQKCGESFASTQVKGVSKVQGTGSGANLRTDFGLLVAMGAAVALLV